MSAGPDVVLNMLDRLLLELEEEPERWENRTLPEYLDAMRAWLDARSRGEKAELSWELVAQMLRAARIYE
jgi:hypothetical protein